MHVATGVSVKVKTTNNSQVDPAEFTWTGLRPRAQPFSQLHSDQ